MKAFSIICLCLILCGCQQTISYDTSKFDETKRPETLTIDTVELALPLSYTSMQEAGFTFDQEDAQEYLECEHDELVCDFEEDLYNTKTHQESLWQISTADASSNTALEALENNNFFLWIDVEEHSLDKVFPQATNSDKETLISILGQPSNMMLSKTGQTCLVYDYQDYVFIFKMNKDDSIIEDAFYFTQNGYKSISLKAKYVK